MDQKKECQTEYDKMRELARDIWIRMSDLEVVLAKEHGEMLDDEDGEPQKYGFLNERARLHLDIPRVYMDVLADLAERIGTEGLLNGEDRIIEEIPEEEEAMIERCTLEYDQKALVLWRKPQFPLSKPSDKCLVVDTSSTSNSEQALESDIQILPVRDSSSSSSDHESELPDDKSSASSDEQEEEGNPAKATKARSSIDLATTHFETSPLDTDDVNELEGLPMGQLEQSFPGAAEQIAQPNSREASSEQYIKEGTAENAQPGPIFGEQYGTSTICYYKYISSSIIGWWSFRIRRQRFPRSREAEDDKSAEEGSGNEAGGGSCQEGESRAGSPSGKTEEVEEREEGVEEVRSWSTLKVRRHVLAHFS